MHIMLNKTTNMGLLSAGLQGGYDLLSNALQNRYNKKQIQLQNKLNIEQWNRQNEYNSPLAQMNRFEAAGLNPNLIYGQGNAGNAGSAPTLEAPFRKAPHIDALGKMAQVIAIQNAKAQQAYTLGQIQLQQTQNEVMEQKINESRGKISLMAAQRGLTLSKGDDLTNQMWVKYGTGSIPQNLEELYRYNVNAQRLKNSILEQQLNNLGLDATLKLDVHQEKSYYNKLRDLMGIEKGDNILIRGGASLFRRAQDYFLGGPSMRYTKE